MDAVKKMGDVLRTRQADVAIIGGGVAGLAHAYMALRKGLSVVLFEKNSTAIGATIRGYGLIAPICELPAELNGGLDLALRTTDHWKNLAAKAGFRCENTGSLHLAYEQDEMDVLLEFESLNEQRPYVSELVSPSSALRRFPCLKADGLMGALWSKTEYTVNPREAVDSITAWLQHECGLVVRHNQMVTSISLPAVVTAKEEWKINRVVVCSGAEYETLFPKAFDNEPLSKCTSQMLKIDPLITLPNIPVWSGLSMLHHPSFSITNSLKIMDNRVDKENILLKRYGIQVQAVHDYNGCLTVGHSHHYGPTTEPFDREEINELILEYLFKFLPLAAYKIIERWHGVYSNIAGDLNRVIEPSPGVQIATGFGEAGFTRCFAHAEDLVESW